MDSENCDAVFVLKVEKTDHSTKIFNLSSEMTFSAERLALELHYLYDENFIVYIEESAILSDQFFIPIDGIFDFKPMFPNNRKFAHIFAAGDDDPTPIPPQGLHQSLLHISLHVF